MAGGGALRIPHLGWALLLLAAAGVDLGVALRPDLPEVSPEGMQSAAAALRAAQQPGDVIVHSPLFSIRELAALGDLPARPDLPAPEVRQVRRVIVLDRRDVPMGGLGTPAEVRPVPGTAEAVVLQIFEPAGPREAVLWSLIERLGPETLRVERPGAGPVACSAPRVEGGFACPGEPEWLHVERRHLTVGGHEESCVWAHPTNGGAMVFAIPAPTAPAPGHRLVLDLRAGLTDDAVRMTPDGAEVRTEVVQGGRVLGAVTVPNRVGWVEDKVDVAPGAPIELRVTTPRDGRRHHCVNADIKELAPPRGEAGGGR